jgi:hypothetical protein
VSGLEVKQETSPRATTTLTEGSHGATEKQDGAVCVIAERTCPETSEGAFFEIGKLVMQIRKNLEKRLEEVELSAHSLQETGSGSGNQEDLIKDDKLDHPSRILEISAKSEYQVIEERIQAKADKEEDESKEAKIVRMERQAEEFGKKSIASTQEVEQTEETHETNAMNARECSDEKYGLHKELKVKGTVEIKEDERISADVQRKSNESGIQCLDSAGNSQKDLMDLKEEPKKLTSIERGHDIDRKMYGGLHSTGAEELNRGFSVESRNVLVEGKEQHYYPLESTDLEESLEDIESVISKELASEAFEGGKMQEEMVQSKPEEQGKTQHDYELEILEMDACVEEYDFKISDEQKRMLSQEAGKLEEIVQRNISSSLELMISNIENKMHAKMPNDVKKSVDECFRKVVESSLTELKRNIRSLQCKLRASKDISCWLQSEMQRLCSEFIKQARREDVFKDQIGELQQKLNSRSITLQASDNYARQLLGKYDEVTLNIELEMKKHRSLCEDYRSLRSKYEELKAKCENAANAEGGSEIAGHVSVGTLKRHEEATCAVTDMEQQMSVLVQSQRDLKKKVKSFRMAPSAMRSLSAGKVDDTASLDKIRKEFMVILGRQPRKQCELIEATLMTKKNDYVSTMCHPSPGSGHRQRIETQATVQSQPSHKKKKTKKKNKIRGP